MWEKIIDLVDRGSRDCAQGLSMAVPPDQVSEQQAREASQRFETALQELRDALTTDVELQQQISTLSEPAIRADHDAHR